MRTRLTVTVDPETAKVAEAAVAAGRAPSVSAWVAEAMTERARRERLADVLAEIRSDLGPPMRRRRGLEASSACSPRSAALVAIERADRRVIRLLELAGGNPRARRCSRPGVAESGAPVRLVRVLGADPVHVHALDNEEAKAVGHLCGASGTSDVVDASVVLVACRVGGVTISSDPDDLHVIDPHLEVVDC